MNNSESKKLVPFPVQTMKDYPEFHRKIYFRPIYVLEGPCSGLDKGNCFPLPFLKKRKILLTADIFMRLTLGLYFRLYMLVPALQLKQKLNFIDTCYKCKQ
jgi:hypothetical protein